MKTTAGVVKLKQLMADNRRADSETILFGSWHQFCVTWTLDNFDQILNLDLFPAVLELISAYQ